MTDNLLSARDTILKLSRAHNVVYAPDSLDSWALAVTRHAGDDVNLDEIGYLILALERANVLNAHDADLLHIRYMRERAR